MLLVAICFALSLFDVGTAVRLKGCRAPLPQVGRVSHPDKTWYKHGSLIMFSCEDGFFASAPRKPYEAACFNGAFLPPIEATCARKTWCDHIPTIENAEMDREWLSEGELVTYKCKSGFYHDTGVQMVRVCVGGSVDVAGVDCKPMIAKPAVFNSMARAFGRSFGAASCSSPPAQEGRTAHPSKSSYEENEVVVFTCDDGYVAQTPGSMYEAVCLDGKFVFEMPADCAKKTWCDHIPDIENTWTDYSFLNDGETVTYTCLKGFYPDDGVVMSRVCKKGFLDTWGIACRPLIN